MEIAFFTLHCQNSTNSLWFLQLFELTTHTHAVWLPISCNQCIQLGAVMGHGLVERKLTALQQLNCVKRTMHQCAIFWVSSFARWKAEALDRWGGKTKHRRIPYFLGNSSVKSYHNRIVYATYTIRLQYVKIIPSQRWDVFETQCYIGLHVYFWRLLPPIGIFPGAEFTLCPNLAFSNIGRVTARHSSSGRQPNFAAFSNNSHYAVRGHSR